MKQPSARKLSLAGFASTCAILAAVTLASNPHPRVRTEAAAGRLPDPEIERIVCLGTTTSLADAQAGMTFPIELPQDPLANDSTLKQVWRCSDTQVAFEYESGVVLYLSENALSDPVAVWKKMAELYPEFSVGVVRGIQAELADPEKSQGADGGVEFVENGIRVTVSGNGEIPLSDLIRVTESISPFSR